ncbi:uncharacterized protein TNCV_2891691 [Trichonephila clavipes]|nr:uncharacterized protein TNCV_2891691 [Trichonephila clavipes]
MDHIILNHCQVTWTTPELAPPPLTTTPHQREDVSAFDRFNVHRCPIRRVFSGTVLELVTRQATPLVGIFCPRHCLIHETKHCSRRGKLPLLTRFLTLLEERCTKDFLFILQNSGERAQRDFKCFGYIDLPLAFFLTDC